MRNARTLVILAVLTVVFVLAAIFARQEPATFPQQGERLFPGLLPRVNDVAQVVATSREGSLTLERTERGWVVREKHGYAADREMIQRLLLGTAELRRLEPKTRNPERYADIGLQDVSAEGSKSLKFSLKNEKGQVLAEYLLGESRLAKGDPAGREYFVRLPEDPQTWLVEGWVPEDKSLMRWLDRQVVKIDDKRVREVRVRHADGHELAVRRASPQAGDYGLVGLPKGAEIESPYAVNSIGTTLADLTFDDVRPAAELDLKGAALNVTLATFDGLRITMQTFKRGKLNLARLQAASTAPPGGQVGGDKPAKKENVLKTPEQVKQEAETLNARWRGWVYVIPQYRVDSLAKKMPELTRVSGKRKPASGGAG